MVFNPYGVNTKYLVGRISGDGRGLHSYRARAIPAAPLEPADYGPVSWFVFLRLSSGAGAC
jgi:hypothetical protein